MSLPSLSVPPSAWDGAARGILLIEDEALFARAVSRRLEKAGYTCIQAGTLRQGLDLAAEFQPDLVLLDLRLPDGDGLECLAALSRSREEKPVPVVVMTAFGEVADAVRAMKLGAVDYLKKPIDLEEMLLAVENALKSAGLLDQLVFSRERESRAAEGVVLLGDSPALHEVRGRIAQLGALATPGVVAPSVLIQGETGSGKDVVARLLHQASANRGAPFVHVDCASLPRDLMEAELFGHERGAYTGAAGARAGLMEAAEDGTLFLDEISELPLDLQAKLLNVIERRRVRRIGSTRERILAARFIAASNRDLRTMVQQGSFRSDLYFRLNVLTLTLPPLRARGDDVMLLARHYADQTARRYGLAAPLFCAEALSAMRLYPWPGNVRELKHLVERAVLLCEGRSIGPVELALPQTLSVHLLPEATAALPEDTPLRRADHDGAAADPLQPLDAGPDSSSLFDMTLGRAERLLIEHALRVTGGNRSEAARRLGVTRMTLRYRMEKYRLRVDGSGGGDLDPE